MFDYWSEILKFILDSLGINKTEVKNDIPPVKSIEPPVLPKSPVTENPIKKEVNQESTKIEDFQLSSNFSFYQLTVTEVRQYQEKNRQEALKYQDSLKNLCENLLEPLQEKFGKLHVNSGYRCLEVNKAVGGSPTSQHSFGQAADINLVNESNNDGRTKMIKYAAKNLKFHQVLEEFGCCHIALPKGENDQQAAFAERINGVWVKKPIQL